MVPKAGDTTKAPAASSPPPAPAATKTEPSTARTGSPAPASAPKDGYEAARPAPVELRSGAGAAPADEAQATAQAAELKRTVEGSRLVGDAVDLAAKNRVVDQLKAGVAGGAAGAAPTEPLDPAKPTQGMTPEEQAAYEQLPPDQRQRYDQIHEQAAERSQYNFVGPRMDVTRSQEAVGELRDLLTSGRFGEYAAVEKALEDSGQGDQVREARGLLLQGTLTDGTARDGGGDLLSYLGPLAQGGTTSQGVNRHELLGQLVSDVANPERMVQGRGNRDCGGTAAALIMALSSPAEYGRVVTGLAEKGEVVLRSDVAHALNLPGHTLKLDGSFDPNDKSRSMTQQLFAKAFVNDADRASGGQGLFGAIKDIFESGLYGRELRGALQNLTGSSWSSAYVPDATEGTPEQRAEAQGQAERLLRESAGSGNYTVANVDGHWVAVLGVTGTGDNASVHVADGSGNVVRMSMKDFLEKVDSVVYESSASTGVPEWMQDDALGDGGGGINGNNGTNDGED